MKIAIVGAGVAGLTLATELASRDIDFEMFEASERLGEKSCSRYAGGMLAPFCEVESAEQQVVHLGKSAASWWQKHAGLVYEKGSLVLAPNRDQNELKRFAARTSNYDWVDDKQLSGLEPDLAGRFKTGLFFKDEAHLDPRHALKILAEPLVEKGRIQFGCEVDIDGLGHDLVVDTRGFASRDKIETLRGVRGEMLILRCSDVQLSRPVRLIHPRYPIYIVPRENNLFMLGATMIETSEKGPVTARSMMELLNAAYALHPAFGEAQIEEIGCDIRPAYKDNLPRVEVSGKVMSINGLYRHGFLLGPAMAIQAADMVIEMTKKGAH